MFTNRFYFSAKQQEVADSLGDDGRNFIVLSTDMEIPYTEWCSSPDSVSHWDDARLVYASDTVPQIHHQIGEQEAQRLDELWEDMGELEDDIDPPWSYPQESDDYLRGIDFDQDT